MKKMVKVAALALVLATLISIGQTTVMAAPAQGGARVTAPSSNDRFSGFLRLLGAIWGGRAAVWSDRGAIWGYRTALWGGGK